VISCESKTLKMINNIKVHPWKGWAFKKMNRQPNLIGLKLTNGNNYEIQMKVWIIHPLSFWECKGLLVAYASFHIPMLSCCYCSHNIIFVSWTCDTTRYPYIKICVCLVCFVCDHTLTLSSHGVLVVLFVLVGMLLTNWHASCLFYNFLINEG